MIFSSPTEYRLPEGQAVRFLREAGYESRIEDLLESDGAVISVEEDESYEFRILKSGIFYKNKKELLVEEDSLPESYGLEMVEEVGEKA
jgi:aromatic ring-opening dioxygenase LigB subunit